MKQIIKAFTLFYIFLSIIWLPFQYYIFKLDGAGRTIMIVSAMAILLNIVELWNQKKIFSSSTFLCWVLLLCYSMANAFSKGFYAEFGTFAFLRKYFFDSFVFLIILMLELNRNKLTCLWVIWTALGLYLLIGFRYFAPSIVFEDRFAVEGMGNLFPLNAICFLFVSVILYIEEKINLALLLVITVAVSMIIFMTATRKAFGAEAFILFGVILNNGKKRDLWSWVRMGLLSIVFVIGINYVMNNSIIGERILGGASKNDYVQLSQNEVINDFLMVLLGDRAIQYEMAIELYHENFWTGIGLTNFMDVTGSTMVLHSEYMVQLCENGIIGFVLLILFYVSFIIALIRSRKKSSNTRNKNSSGMALFGLVTILFLNLTGWTYNQVYIMVFYAILYMYAYFNHDTEIIDIDKYEDSNTSSNRKL